MQIIWNIIQGMQLTFNTICFPLLQLHMVKADPLITFFLEFSAKKDIFTSKFHHHTIIEFQTSDRTSLISNCFIFRVSRCNCNLWENILFSLRNICMVRNSFISVLQNVSPGDQSPSIIPYMPNKLLLLPVEHTANPHPATSQKENTSSESLTMALILKLNLNSTFNMKPKR